jgi:uncharacterized protein YjbI with pentapeptide repeats
MCRKKTFCVGMAVVCLFLVWSAPALYGFDEKHVQMLKKTNKCPKCDLSGAKLNNLDLSNADLSSANLSGADLSNSILYQGDLSNANLSGANLSNANLSEVSLSGANVSKANFTKTYLDQSTWINGKRCKIGSVGQCKQ